MSQTSGDIRRLRLTLPVEPISEPASGAAIQLRRNPDATLKLSLTRETSSLSVVRDLRYFIGSGRVGRSFLFQTDGFLYQSPVSWYADGDTWRASPGYQRKATVDMTRPVEPSCLLCHASRLQPVTRTQNGYTESRPFLEEGIGCERCHGPGAQHVRLMNLPRRQGRSGIVNVSRLAAPERDSVCAQCHLTGAVRVARAATKGRESYHPGGTLADSVAVFVWSGAEARPIGVTSHFEALSWSRCKKASGDRLWCGTCHSVHGSPVSVRQQCVGCHAQASARKCSLNLAERRARNGDECQSCHMRKSDVKDAQHAVYTDHSIPRVPRRRDVSPAAGNELIPFWTDGPQRTRDLALAYATAALDEPSVRRRAFDLLRSETAANPGDMALTAQLAQFYDRLGQTDQARELFEKVLAADAANTAVLINLGGLYAQYGRLQEAMTLWERALTKNPALTQARMNLAVAQARLGDRERAVATLKTALVWDPDNPTLTKLLQDLQ